MQEEHSGYQTARKHIAELNVAMQVREASLMQQQYSLRQLSESVAARRAELGSEARAAEQLADAIEACSAREALRESTRDAWREGCGIQAEAVGARLALLQHEELATVMHETAKQ
eukprot:TRINITY_DN2077_c0_g1_i1.p4 TRINITY_DN2077_c0_g1~~TRINITY_DN2077_c0_g1_i1.p4  ORF type:complete len:115 (+),score=42.03 TRINITY_DN2077_c0_g1_i1:133-477(+)